MLHPAHALRRSGSESKRRQWLPAGAYIGGLQVALLRAANPSPWLEAPPSFVDIFARTETQTADG